MWIQHIIIALLFFIFTILQNSFLPYFNILGTTPNIVFILFFILIFFDNPSLSTQTLKRKVWNGEGFLVAILAGLFLDMFIDSYFGISITSLIIVYFLQKLIFHFLEKNKEEYFVLNFIIMFSISFILYNLLLYSFSIVFNFEINLGWNLMVNLIHNLIFAIIGFYFYKFFIKEDDSSNQLKLL